MNALLVVCLLCAATLGMPSQMVIERTNDASRADEQQGGFARIDLHPALVSHFGKEPPCVKRVLWCRALPPVGTTSATQRSTAFTASSLLDLPEARDVSSSDLQGCATPGLVHMQLYPGSHVAVHQPRTEPHVVLVDTRAFYGAWDESHAMEVVVEMRINATASARHISRFHAPMRAAAVSSSPASAHGSHSHNWGGAAILFIAGGALIACVTALRVYADPAQRWIKRRIAWARAQRGEELESAFGAADEEDTDAAVMRAMGHGSDL